MPVSPMVSRIDELVQDFNNGSSVDDLVHKTGLPVDTVRRLLDVMKSSGRIPSRQQPASKS